MEEDRVVPGGKIRHVHSLGAVCYPGIRRMDHVYRTCSERGI